MCQNCNNTPLEPIQTPLPDNTPIQLELELNEVETINCACCNDSINTDDAIESVDGKICESCSDDNYFYCENCENISHNDNAICVDDDYYFCSDSCAHNKGYYECRDCDTWYNSNDEGGSNDRGDGICSLCLENYYSCDDCGDTVSSDNARHNDDGIYCGDCFDNNRNSDTIKPYSYKPRAYVYTKMEYENTMYLGIELEVESNDRTDDAESVMAWLKERGVDNMVYIKEDGSLDDGFEIVFHPITLKAMYSKFPMKEFMEYLKTLDLKSSSVDTCGLHVHLSRKKMSNESIYNGKIFFYKCAYYLKSFSLRYKFNYCKFDDSMPQTWNDQPAGRYSAFNSCTSDKTVELRLFKGTLKHERLLVCLQFSDCFGEYIQKVKDIKAKDSEILWEDFILFAIATGEYGELVQYITKKGII